MNYFAMFKLNRMSIRSRIVYQIFSTVVAIQLVLNLVSEEILLLGKLLIDVAIYWVFVIASGLFHTKIVRLNMFKKCNP